jgi:hypothetical protein
MKKLYSIVIAFLMVFNLSLFAQDGPPWDFNGTDNGFVAQNYASLTVGDTYVTFTLNDADEDGDAESPNSNFRNLDAGIDTSLGGFIAITMKNETANNKMQAILGSPGGGCGCYVNFETLSANDADFVTHYINVGANSNWTGTLSEIIFRFKKGNGVNNQTFAGDILIDHIEIVESIPATPRVDYTFDDTSDSEGFSGVNGITLTQPLTGELYLDIAAQSPYPKLEQTGLYSVDADTYKYVQVTLVNNSPKNKLTLVSPSGGNEYSTRDMVANDGVVQTYELDLTALTNWNGTQANWWLQLVENAGDGPVASAGIINIQQILFATESIMPPDLACDESFSHTYGNSESGTLFSASNPGGEVTVTVTGQTETNYDFLIITDGAGNELYNASGDHTGQAITSSDGTIFVEIVSDSSISGYPLDFAVTCPPASTNVTFSVNTENIEVGANGIYVGGGVLGGSDAYALSDDDADGVWETTIALAPGTTGNYIFFNSPNGSSDWGTKENLNGQDCADPANYDDRILDPVGEEDYILLHCFGECSGNGTGECPSPSTTYDVTFSVNMSNYPGGLGDGNVFLNGNFNGWCGDCTPMSDDDGDGIWTVTVALEDGDYEYKFTVNGWSVQEEFGSIGAVEGCTVTDGTYTNRAFTVAGADMTLETVFWNLCPGETPGQVYNVTFAVDTANINVGDSGMYLGGGGFGNAQGHLMSDDDGDGIYEVTLEVNTDQIGSNYIFLNGPGDGGDWGAKEDLAGQECADTSNYNDRILPEFDGDTYLMHCFGDCSGDGVGCSTAEEGVMVLQGIIDFTVPSGGSDGKAIHIFVTHDIEYLHHYGIGVANNGGGSDGQEYTFPEGSASAGQHILIARSPAAMEAYGITGFDQVFEASSDISQNGDDAIELYHMSDVYEVFGDVDVDGTGEAWEYTDSWAYKVDDAWTYGGVDCTDGSTTTCDSGCPYPFVECSAGPCPEPDITSWSMTGDGAIFDGNNQDGVIGYQIEYSTSTFTPGDGTATVYEFDSFPHTLTGLESNTTYYFTIRSICGDDNYSDWTDNGNDGPDAWTTTICPGSYSLPYLNDFNDPDAWTNCQTFYDNDADGNYWFYVNYADIDGEGNNVAASASWTSATGALTPDNWVIMGPIDLTDHSDALLEWKVRGIDPAWCQENYSVYVGSSNNYNDLINGSVSYNETIANGGDACGNTFAERSLDISAATGGLVYIGFRHHDVTDVFVLNVDDVSVTSSTMSNEDFTLQNIDYSFDQETNLLRVTSEEMLSNIQIYNMLGQEVLNQDLNDTSALLNLSSLSSSIYIVNVEGNNSKTKTFKLAIK